MREIKYRILSSGYSFETGKRSWQYYTLPYEHPDDEFGLVEEETIGLYTGLKDKNGVEVYEGDVLDIKTGSKREDYKGVVVYESGGFWAYSSLDERATGWSFPDMVGLFRGFSFEVIGNIYENPELLEN